jgi:hypothetical protein
MEETIQLKFMEEAEKAEATNKIGDTKVPKLHNI